MVNNSSTRNLLHLLLALLNPIISHTKNDVCRSTTDIWLPSNHQCLSQRKDVAMIRQFRIRKRLPNTFQRKNQCIPLMASKESVGFTCDTLPLQSNLPEALALPTFANMQLAKWLFDPIHGKSVKKLQTKYSMWSLSDRLQWYIVPTKLTTRFILLTGLCLRQV